MFQIVQFDDGIQVVPGCWLMGSNSCYWPDCINQAKINKLISQEVEPNKDTWGKRKVLCIFGKANNYADAVLQLNLYFIVSDTESGVSDTDSGKFQKRIMNESSDDSEDEGASRKRKLPKFSSPEIDNLSCEVLQTDEYPSQKDSSASASETVLDAEFRQTVLRKLDLLMAKMESIEEQISMLSATTSTTTTTTTENKQWDTSLWYKFPIKSSEELEEIESLLQDDQKMAEVVEIFSKVGGHSDQTLVTNLLRKILTDEVAEQFSWAGAKLKRAFKNLILKEAVTRAIMMKSATITEDFITLTTSAFLKHAKQRLQRKEEKSKK